MNETKKPKKNLPDFEYDINGNSISFMGNTNLKGLNTQLAYTKEHIEEYIKCSKDFKYFAENYYKILSLDEGMINPKLRDYQIDMVESFINRRFTIVLASRQAGKSTSFEIFVCWMILFQSDQRIAILANKAEQSRDILRKVKQAYELLPKWLQQGVKVWNVGNIFLENGNSVIAASTSSTAIRGRSISLLIIDERGFIPSNIWDSFFSSVYPTISSGKNTKVIFVSTFNGMNHFYKDWIDALEGKSKFHPIRVDWWQVPGRDEKWKEETIANIGIQRFRSEYGNEALGSISTLVDPEFIKDLKHREPLQETNYIHKSKHLKIYVEPIPGHEYVIGVDSAKMTSENSGDALGMQVLDITTYPIKQVATFFAPDSVSYLESPNIAYNLGTYYNKALMFIENNEIGQEVANIVHFDLEYENVYFEKPQLPGFRTTKKTKRLGCTNLKLLIENNKIEINDYETIFQISTFIKSKESYKAESGYSDDAIMALIHALFFMQIGDFDFSLGDSKKLLSDIVKQKLESTYDDDYEAPLFGFLPEDEYSPKDVW